MKLFGTDGIRGKANEFPITPEVALRAGKAVAQVLRSSGHNRNRVVIGMTAERASASAIRYSTQENMKQKNAATPMPLAISGMKIFTKKLGKEWPSI